MKILMDTVYTGPASTCSASFASWEVIKKISAANPEAYFQMAVPLSQLNNEAQREFLETRPYRDRVQFFATDAEVTDRMSELFRFPEVLRKKIRFLDPEMWDADFVISNRITQLTNFRINSGRPVSFGRGSFCGLMGIDEFPMLSFRDTALWGNTGNMDLHTCAQYLVADYLLMQDLWTKPLLLKTARNILTPSQLKRLDENIHETVSAPMEPMNVQNRRKTRTPFNVIFAGRVSGTKNFSGVAEVFRNHFSYAIGKADVKFIVSTQSMSFGSSDPGDVSFIDFQHNTREEFYELLKERAHVVVNLSDVEDFSLSTYEPLSFGVPVVVRKKPWSEFLGPEYPFRAANEIEAYAMVNEMILNYDAMYDKFVAWHSKYWLAFAEKYKSRSTADVAAKLVAEFVAKRDEKFATCPEYGGEYRRLADELGKNGPARLNLWDYAKERQMITGSWFQSPIAKKPDIRLLKLLVMACGYKDTVETGVVVRRDAA